MKNSVPLKFLALAIWAAGFGPGYAAAGESGENPTAGSINLPNSPSVGPFKEVVLFAFDDWAFPFRYHVETRLYPAGNPRIVLRSGPAGSHDEVLHYYGTTIRIGDRFYMWYNGNYGPIKPNSPAVERVHCCLCYATSPDGVNWTKPDLGLVEFNGSKHNNIVDFPDPDLWSTCALLYDPAAPEAERRFKMAYEGGPGPLRFHVAFSGDGLHWKLSARNPVGPFLEMAGVARIGDLYYVTGQAEPTNSHRRPARRLATFVSADFEHWSSCGAVGLDRSPDVEGPSTDDQQHQLEEVHLGAALWNRGNVLLGIYGQWHGHPSGERRLVVMDLGLLVTHDAVHFEEPIRDFRLIPAREQPGGPIGMAPALIQGQGMENVGDKTLYWYSPWRAYGETGVSMVTWPRDRIGALEPFSPIKPEAISCPILASGDHAGVFINASGRGRTHGSASAWSMKGFVPSTVSAAPMRR